MLVRISSNFYWLVGLLFAAAAVACAPVSPSTASPTLAAPAAPALSVEPGTTKLTAKWGAVADATSYRVRWRPQGEGFAADSLETVTDPAATFTVAGQGLWVVRVQACNDDGCSRPATATAPVIINISGHQAVRVWDDADDVMQVDWDALPGHYIVKYRTSTDNTKWKSSPPLAKPGYAITNDDFTDFSREKGIGHPIIRVFFDCNADGERCALLGRYPNTTMEELAPFWERVTPRNPYETEAGDSEPRQILDPLTHMLRPATDFTITNELWPGENETRECVSRPAENRWERALFGEVIKKCSGIATINDTYILDENAVFPDDATCGERPARNDDERRAFDGDTVKVCNAHPDEVDDNTTNEDTSNNDVTGATHISTHSVHWKSLDWPARYATEYDPDNMTCKNGDVDNPGTYRPTPLLNYNHITTVTVRWCYHYRSHVDKVQTIGNLTVTSVPNALQRSAYGFQFCGWQPGTPDYAPETHSNRYPYEILWHYVHPVAQGYLPWGYTSTVRPWYGNVGKVKRNAQGVIISITPAYKTEQFRNLTTIVADWEGQSTLWSTD